MKKLFTLFFLLLMVACKPGGGEITPEAPELSRISIQVNAVSSQLDLTVGDTASFTATAHYSDNTQKNVTNEVSWNSTSSSVASIASNGGLSALSAGDTHITASMDGVTSNRVLVSVSDKVTLTDINISFVSASTTNTNGEYELTIGNNLTLKATGTYSDNSTKDVTNEVNWTSSNNVFASITSNTLVGITEGLTNITASMDNVTSNNLKVLVVADTTLTAIKIETIFGAQDELADFDPGTLADRYNTYLTLHTDDDGEYHQALYIGHTTPLKAVGVYSDGTTKDITNEVTWQDKAGKVLLDANKITGDVAGKAQIVASLGSVQSSELSIAISNVVHLDSDYTNNRGKYHFIEPIKGIFSSTETYQMYYTMFVNDQGKILPHIDHDYAQGDDPGSYASVADQLVDVQQIASSEQNTYAALKSDGSVVTWGYDTFGSDMDLLQPELVNIKQILARELGMWALREDGRVFTWGEPNLGQSFEYEYPFDENITDVAQLYWILNGVLALKTDGTLAFWGGDRIGTTDSLLDKLDGMRSQLKDIKSVSADDTYGFSNGSIAVVKNDGSVISIVAPDTNSYLVDGMCASNASYSFMADTLGWQAMKGYFVTQQDGRLSYCGKTSTDKLEELAQMPEIDKVFVDKYSNILLAKDKTVHLWMPMEINPSDYESEYQQKYIDSFNSVAHRLTNVKQVFRGETESYALKEDGTLVVWGVRERFDGLTEEALELLNQQTDIKAMYQSVDGLSHVFYLLEKEDGTFFMINREGLDINPRVGGGHTGAGFIFLSDLKRVKEVYSTTADGFYFILE